MGWYHTIASVEQDLVEEDVMILDTYSEVFVWIGRGANEVEKKEGLKAAVDYIQTDPSKRDLDSTLLIQVWYIIIAVNEIKLMFTHSR